MAECAQANALNIPFKFMSGGTARGDQTITNDFAEGIVGIFGQAAANEAPGNGRCVVGVVPGAIT